MSHLSNRFAFEVRDSRWSKARKFRFGYGCHCLCQERVVLENVPNAPSRRLLDLLRIASSVFFTDRIIARNRQGGPNSWSRTISLSLHVADMEFWADPTIKQRLVDALEFVSGDSWTIGFSPLHTGGTTGIQWQPPLASKWLPSRPRLCLYSGGLDSAAGLARQLSSPDAKEIVAITVRHRLDLEDKVKTQLRAIGKVFGREPHSVCVPFEMKSPTKLVASEETSQRSRAFLFVTIGAAVADGFGMSELEMFESGVGAINVPLMTGMQGSQATRGSHPHFLHLMSELLTLVVGRRFHLVLPFLTMTKGELVDSLARPELRQIANDTFSCPSFPVRVPQAGRQQSCGVCAACLFRRLAMHTAGIEEDCANYQYDFLSRNTTIPIKKRRYLAAFLNQVDCLTQTDLQPLPINLAKHLRQTHVIEDGCSLETVSGLFRRYRDEWLKLIRHAQSRGCQWTKLIDLPTQAT
jgi:7-cyano-7-deazaguanine synthase in queuosine biosynthesis